MKFPMTALTKDEVGDRTHDTNPRPTDSSASREQSLVPMEFLEEATFDHPECLGSFVRYPPHIEYVKQMLAKSTRTRWSREPQLHFKGVQISFREIDRGVSP